MPFAPLLAAAILLCDKTPKWMPPPIEHTLHMFRESPDGGVQDVFADDGVSSDKVAALRDELRREAIEYAHGGYADPDGTANVGMLRSAYARIHVTFTKLDHGGEIRFRTSDPALVNALHGWMSAVVRADRKLHPAGGPGQDTT
jgi:hypothetical protein